MLVLDVKYCEKAQKHGNSVSVRAKYFRFLSQRNSALRIISAIRVPNLVNATKNCAR